MNKQVRQGVFETNSSSCHTISICKKNINDLMEFQGNQTIEFNGGEFGWEFDLHTDLQSKADYLWTGVVTSGLYKHEEIQKIKKNIEDTLAIYNITAEFEPYQIKKWSDPTMGDEYCKFSNFSYIDHAYDVRDFLEAMFPNNGEDINESLFLSYLFNRSSYIETGNDNSDNPPEFNYPSQEDGEVVEFYKGN